MNFRTFLLQKQSTDHTCFTHVKMIYNLQLIGNNSVHAHEICIYSFTNTYDLNATNRFGLTPLHITTQHKFIKCVELFFIAGANVIVQDIQFHRTLTIFNNMHGTYSTILQ